MHPLDGFGVYARRKVLSLGSAAEGSENNKTVLCAEVHSLSIHAGVRSSARNSKGVAVITRCNHL